MIGSTDNFDEIHQLFYIILWPFDYDSNLEYQDYFDICNIMESLCNSNLKFILYVYFLISIPTKQIP